MHNHHVAYHSCVRIPGKQHACDEELLYIYIVQAATSEHFFFLLKNIQSTASLDFHLTKPVAANFPVSRMSMHHEFDAVTWK
jgi:hypothetical protein